jgi:hypothetical protein
MTDSGFQHLTLDERRSLFRMLILGLKFPPPPACLLDDGW